MPFKEYRNDIDDAPIQFLSKVSIYVLEYNLETPELYDYIIKEVYIYNVVAIMSLSCMAYFRRQ